MARPGPFFFPNLFKTIFTSFFPQNLDLIITSLSVVLASLKRWSLITSVPETTAHQNWSICTIGAREVAIPHRTRLTEKLAWNLSAHVANRLWVNSGRRLLCVKTARPAWPTLWRSSLAAVDSTSAFLSRIKAAWKKSTRKGKRWKLISKVSVVEGVVK